MNGMYEIKQYQHRFYVQWTDENGETWDADTDGIDSLEEAEAFKAELESSDFATLYPNGKCVSES
jgi:hypothetical protein